MSVGAFLWCRDEIEVYGSLAVVVGVAGWVRGYWKDWMSCGTGPALIAERPFTLKLRMNNALMDPGECGLKMSSRARRGIGSPRVRFADDANRMLRDSAPRIIEK